MSKAPDLRFPKNFFLPSKPRLQQPLAQYKTTWHYYQDVLLNILGFMPYGFFLFAWLLNTRLSRFAILFSFLSGAVFSFLIEFAQGYIPQRDSGWNDVITNSLGALLGSLIARSLQRK